MSYSNGSPRGLSRDRLILAEFCLAILAATGCGMSTEKASPEEAHKKFASFKNKVEGMATHVEAIDGVHVAGAFFAEDDPYEVVLVFSTVESERELPRGSIRGEPTKWDLRPGEIYNYAALYSFEDGKWNLVSVSKRQAKSENDVKWGTGEKVPVSHISEELKTFLRGGVCEGTQDKRYFDSDVGYNQARVAHIPVSIELKHGRSVVTIVQFEGDRQMGLVSFATIREYRNRGEGGVVGVVRMVDDGEGIKPNLLTARVGDKGVRL